MEKEIRKKEDNRRKKRIEINQTGGQRTTVEGSGRETIKHAPLPQSLCISFPIGVIKTHAV